MCRAIVINSLVANQRSVSSWCFSFKCSCVCSGAYLSPFFNPLLSRSVVSDRKETLVICWEIINRALVLFPKFKVVAANVFCVRLLIFFRYKIHLLSFIHNKSKCDWMLRHISKSWVRRRIAHVLLSCSDSQETADESFHVHRIRSEKVSKVFETNKRSYLSIHIFLWR